MAELVKNRLKQLREGQGLSVAQLADATGVKSSSISFQENGKRAITVETAVIYCDFFKCTLDYLFCRDDKTDVFQKYQTKELVQFLEIIKEEVDRRNEFREG